MQWANTKTMHYEVQSVVKLNHIKNANQTMNNIPWHTGKVLQWRILVLQVFFKQAHYKGVQF